MYPVRFTRTQNTMYGHSNITVSPKTASHLLHEAQDQQVLPEYDCNTPQEPLLATVKQQKLAWFGHVIRHDFLCNTVLHGKLKELSSNIFPIVTPF
ncbi:hypothetical protein DPMN_070639 [Dreissena polymorpha]|uniref:Uncharacterized protein n=1 Tax=Dreissena polymorpha TaxID=45954 RepID=A0A9D4BVS5_DREPO|nr:hypothetical protein DPMN_070639 [Dreissena polymorpha]